MVIMRVMMIIGGGHGHHESDDGGGDPFSRSNAQIKLTINNNRN